MNNNNVFQILKEKFIPDLEFVFDFASVVTDKIIEKFPDIKYESLNTGNIGFIMKTNGCKYEFHADIMDCDYDTGAPRVSVGVCYNKPVNTNNRYVDDELTSNHTYCCRIAHASITKYTRNITTWNKKELGKEELEMLDWFIDIVSAVNDEINKLKGTNVSVSVSPWKPIKYEEYEDD